jgi:predicted 3-demethylubiquinone-9 3-methyltransferase (glyoxalase superfamily)
MTKRIEIIYKSAIKNNKFLNDIKEADGDKKPTIFATEQDKIIFATIYYGWLVGKYGVSWEINV